KKKPARISLPVSPFVKESYWIKEVKIDNQQNNDIDSLVYQNISDINGLKFTTKMHEWGHYFKDHVIEGSGVLPGVFYLEMASFVAKEVMNEKKRRGVRFKDVMWSKPFNQQDASSPLIVGIYPQQNQSM